MNERKYLHLAISLLIAACMLLVTAFVSARAREDLDASPKMSEGRASIAQLNSTVSGLEFVLTTPNLVEDGAGTVEVPGLENIVQEPGAPALPYYATYVAVPPDADVSVSVKELDVMVVSVGSIKAVPQLAPQLPQANGANNAISASSFSVSDLQSATPALISRPDPAIYQKDAVYPPAAYTVSAPMYFRDLRLVEIRLYPLTYNPVQGTLRQARQAHVTVSFKGVRLTGLRPAPSRDDSYQNSMANLVLNYEQARAWRDLPASFRNAQSSGLPLNTDVYKIELSQDGIYEIDAADLAAAGMAIGAVDPSTVEMMNRGQAVGYQFIGDGDNVLELGERFRFYGQAFDGPRTEKQFITNNVYWLWSAGTPTTIVTKTNEAGMGYTPVAQFQESITREPEIHFFATWTRWDGFPNEPDAWFWDLFSKATPPLTKTFTITLPHPVASGPDATYTVEMNSRNDLQNPAPPHMVNVFVNTNPTLSAASWYGLANINISDSVPITDLVHGPNTVTIGVVTTFVDQIYLNRITVDYTRQLIAVGDQLFFGDDTGGSREFRVAGMSQGNVNDALVWDITNPAIPVQIELQPGDISGSGGSFTYTVGVSQSVAGARFLASTVTNIVTSTQVSQYTPTSLDPVSGQAEWLAITHRDFITEVNRLAAHRQDPDFGGMTTHVVDIEDIINQYGYGLPLPAAINGYLSFALANWTVAPSYVVLVGDATQNPKHLDCPLISQGGSCSVWDRDEPTYVLADLVFEDRFAGLIPTDHTFVLLSGNDLLPDMSIGRLPVKSAADAAAVVDKIILYEQNQFTPQSWQQNMLFVADNTDTGGNFCAANQSTGGSIPNGLIQTHLCLDFSGPISNTSIMTALMSAEINGNGVSVLSYRGHGAIDMWANEPPDPPLMTSGSTGFWANSGKPIILLSADCLDAWFTWPGRQSLGESFLRLNGVGTAAHWSSSGLGFTGEHTVLQTGLYEGIFDQNLTALGDAINYAKVRYNAGGFDSSELYSFTLLGDPAMRFLRPEVLLDKQAVQSNAYPGDQVQFALTISNTGIYPAKATITDTLPLPLSFVSASSTVPVTVTTSGNDVTVELQSRLTWGAAEVVTITATVSPTYMGAAVNQAFATNSGINLSGVTVLTDTATINIIDVPITGLSATNSGPTIFSSPTLFTATIASGTNPIYVWDFGDSNGASGMTASHTYGLPGVYTATVTVSNSVSMVSATTIVTVAEPISGLTAVNDGPTSLGSTTTFTATVTAGTNPTFVWDFGDGVGTGSGSVTSYQYTSSGVFTATVTATNAVSASFATTTVTVEKGDFALYLPILVKP